MDNLDFSALTDDQLVGLLRAILQEAIRRSPAVVAAVRAASLDEQEKIQIAKESADREAAKIRASERERIAKEAAEAVRKQAAAQAAIDQNARIAKEAAEAVAKAAEADATKRAILAEAAALVGSPSPGEISVIVLPNGERYGGGTRVLINQGSDRYERDHLVDYCGPTKIKTHRELVGKKPAMIEFCARLAATYNRFMALGSEFTWEETEVSGV